MSINNKQAKRIGRWGASEWYERAPNGIYPRSTCAKINWVKLWSHNGKHKSAKSKIKGIPQPKKCNQNHSPPAGRAGKSSLNAV